MNTVNTKLEQIKALGLIIKPDNSWETTNYKAEEYVEEYLYDRDYVVGSVLAETEDMSMAEHDLCFKITEDFYEHLTSDMYHSLHELAKQNDVYAFKEYLDKLHQQYKDEDDESVYGQMSEEIMSYMSEIENELDELIADLTPEDISKIQHEMAEGYQKHIRKEAPWIIGE